MIRGTVNANYEAVLNLRVRGPIGVELDVDVVIDTGATSQLTLTPATIAALGLTFRATSQAILADGTRMSVDTYNAEVEWDGVWLKILVTEVDTNPLLGTNLLIRHEVFIEFVPGGVVDITKLP